MDQSFSPTHPFLSTSSWSIIFIPWRKNSLKVGIFLIQSLWEGEVKRNSLQHNHSENKGLANLCDAL